MGSTHDGTKARRTNRLKRLAENPDALSLEAVLDLGEKLEARLPFLSPKRRAAVVALLTAVRQWCKERQQQMTLENQGLVGLVVNGSYFRALCHLGIPIDDGMQEGYCALMHAATLFDFGRGWQFSTYAIRWIQQRIQRLLQLDKTIRIPCHLLNQRGADLSRFPSCFSLDAGFAGRDTDTEGYALCSRVVGSDDREIRHADARADLAELLACLDARWREIVRLRYIEGLSLEEIAEMPVGENGGRLTRERVRQVIEKALARMRLFAERKRALVEARR